MLSKEDIRNEIFSKRKLADFDILNKKFFENFLKIDFLKEINNKEIAGYYATNEEVNLLKILEFYQNKNKISLPAIKIENDEMIFRKWNCDIKKLTQNNSFKKMKIFEPNNSCEEIIPDIFFIPAVAVDIFGNRVGYGKGYYDKTLKNTSSIKIATIFDFQLFNEEIENNKNDVKVDLILTEKKLFSTKDKK